MIQYRRPSTVMTSACLLLITGCSQYAPDRAERMTRGYIFYCDGAGGGGLITNWSRGIRTGLADAGYDGAGEVFKWETGLGVVADQTASVDYKKRKARELADMMVSYQKAHPGAAVHLMGLSAGTAVVAYALEALPPGCNVDNVIMLSGSLSSGYDLTRALRHVDGKMYVFTSQRDEVLLTMVPISGTADRQSASAGTIGVNGARVPPGATGETRTLYRKIVVIPWNPQFARYGHSGGHTDSVKAPFVQQFVAPLVMTTASRSSTAVASAGPGQVENPDYLRWERFGTGSWVLFEGHQLEGGARRPLRVRTTLVEKEPDRLLIQREAEGDTDVADQLTQSFYVTRHIDARQHPATHPAAQKQFLGDESCQIAGHRLMCRKETVTIKGDFPLWGKDVSATIVSNPSIPGQIAAADLRTTLGGKPVHVAGRAVSFSGAGSR